MNSMQTEEATPWATAESPFGHGLLSPEAAPGPDPRDAPPLRYGYRVGGFHLLVPLDMSSEVLVSPTRYRVPLGPDWLLGVINQRGNIVPVFDLARVCGERTRRAEVHTVLALARGERLLGVAIDGLPRALAPDLEAPASTELPEPAAGHVVGAFAAEGQCWSELDLAALFLQLSGRMPATALPEHS